MMRLMVDSRWQKFGRSVASGVSDDRKMRRVSWISLVILFTVFGCSAARSDDAQTPRDLEVPVGIRNCRSDAHLVDQDLNGVAVRKAPNTASPAITMLPAMRMNETAGGLELYGAEVRIVGTDGRGWFLIED